jgi:tRNA threonylcarbamoyladenosine biosynthesis protein TsaB
MIHLLSIETSTEICSVAVSCNESILSSVHVEEENVHSSFLTTYIESCLTKASLSLKDMHAVVINGGPGSFTGLRIGVAVAKGLCYGKGLPLISINSLYAISHAVKEGLKPEQFILPMIDARNNEVYFALLDSQLNTIWNYSCGEPHSESIIELLKSKEIVFVGNGIRKWGKAYNEIPSAILKPEVKANAQYLIQPALTKFKNKEFENITEYEPYYLRDFKARNLSFKIKRILNA